MRQSIRALGWAITLSTLILFLFLATAFFSLFQTIMMGQGIGFGGFQTSFSNNRLILSVPITVNNTGYYDINDFKLTTALKAYDGTTLLTNSTVIEEIKRGSAETRQHSLSMNLTDILSDMTYLLFNDTEFKIDFSVGFRYAHALSFQLAMMNTSMHWGAPLYGLNLTEVSSPSFNGTHLSTDLNLQLENHSFLDMFMNLSLKIYNEKGKYVGSGKELIHVPPGSRLNEPIKIVIETENPDDFTGRGYVEVYLELPMIDYSFELGRIDYG